MLDLRGNVVSIETSGLNSEQAFVRSALLRLGFSWVKKMFVYEYQPDGYLFIGEKATDSFVQVIGSVQKAIDQTSKDMDEETRTIFSIILNRLNELHKIWARSNN